MNNVFHVGNLLGGSGSTNKIPWDALEYSGQVITAISGSALVGQGDTSQCFPATASSLLQPSGDYAYNSSLSNYLPASSSGNFITSTAGLAPSGDYAYNSSVSGKLDASASSQFALSGDYAYNSAMSSKMDASASGLLQPSGNYAYNSSLSSLIAYSALSGSDNRITAISGSALGGVVPPTTQLILDNTTMSGLIDPETQDFYIGVKSGVFASDSGMSAYATTTYVDSSVSSKLDASSFTSYLATYAPVVIVGNSSEATASNVVYVVTGVPV